jgi:Domain of unknown function (DUF1707)/Cell wall-active antibiotics response 4TMS YvqF
MSSPPAVPDRGNLRASDADRERVADRLREAAGDGRLTMEELDERLDAVYAAKTYAELEPITRDLPQAGAAHAPAPAPVSAPAPAGDLSRVGGVPSSNGAFAILGGFSRKGDWVVPKEFSAVAILGGGEIDLRQARFAEPVVTIHVVTIMGGIEIIVPDDVTVDVTGVGILGAFEHVARTEGQPGGPKIIINGVALLGGVEVKRKPPKKSRRGEELDPGRDYRQIRMDARRERHHARREHRRDRREYRRGELD